MSSTKKQLLSGVFYTAIAKYSGIVISLVVAGVLARLISPDDFGIVAIATVIITFFNIFSDLGIAPAIIQKKELDQKDLSNIFSFTIWTGLLLMICFFFAAWPIADYYNSPILKPICQILSINLFFATINIVPNALLLKNKQFRYIAIRTLSVQIIAGSISVIAALNGAGLYALLINPICSSIGLFCLNFRKYPQVPRLTLGIFSIRKIFSFSAFQFLFNVINYFTRNLDKLLIGKYLGMNPLGYYEKSYRLMMLPLQNITHVITPVMHPIFSEFQNNLRQLAASYQKIIRLLAFTGFPLSVFLYFSSRELVLIIFGSQWEPSVPVFQILSLSVGIQIILSTSGSIFQAANSTKTMFISGLLSAILNIAAILIGVFIYKDLQAVAWGICITFTINFIQCYLLMYKVTFQLPFYPFCRQFFSPFILCVLLYLALFGVDTLIGARLFLLYSFVIKGTITLLIWSVYIQLTGEYDLLKKIKSIRNIKK